MFNKLVKREKDYLNFLLGGLAKKISGFCYCEPPGCT
jgi:hypothetical protein